MDISIASQKKKKSNKNALWALLFCILIGFLVFLFWKKANIGLENKSLQTSIHNIKTQLNEKKGEKSLKSISESQRILIEAQKERINWSDIMQNILVYQTNGIEFENFSISTEKNISATSTAQNLSQVKQLIKTLSGHEKIIKPFVSSVSEQGDGTVNFQLSFQFTE